MCQYYLIKLRFLFSCLLLYTCRSEEYRNKIKYVSELIDMYVRINDGTTGVSIKITNYKNLFIFFTEVMQKIR